MVTRRQFFQWGSLVLGTVAVVAALMPLRRVVAGNTGQFLDPRKQPKFINALPIPKVIDARDGGTFLISMKESQHWFGLYDGNQKLITKIWGYAEAGTPATFPGPTLLAYRDIPFEVRWDNQLPSQPTLLTGRFYAALGKPQKSQLGNAVRSSSTWRTY